MYDDVLNVNLLLKQYDKHMPKKRKTKQKQKRNKIHVPGQSADATISSSKPSSWSNDEMKNEYFLNGSEAIELTSDCKSSSKPIPTAYIWMPLLFAVIASCKVLWESTEGPFVIIIAMFDAFGLSPLTDVNMYWCIALIPSAVF